ncbi:MAG: phosphatidylserine decarboxylase family protein [Prevotellaceae bacterium]|jgi:phosphatidylserine decarboxylase|nr:phosphatidylserine decarboxylase family protein [Prevotellaceae bacterium]
MKTHREGYILLNVTTILFLLVMIALRWIGIAWLLWAGGVTLIGIFFMMIYFFRVPSRTPVCDDKAVIAPADGTVVIVEEVEENEYLKCKCMQVSIFMSIFNVHINWFPVSGTVEYQRHHHGKYLVAWHPKSSEKNERTTIVVNHHGTKILFRQIAGYIARRIVCYAKESMPVEQGQETGFIKFGSRVDLFLPLDAKINVKLGEKVKGTRTVIARIE